MNDENTIDENLEVRRCTMNDENTIDENLMRWRARRVLKMYPGYLLDVDEHRKSIP
jgi:hypothetical protein